MNSAKILVISTWLLIVLMIPLGLFGQTTLQYNGPFELSGYHGTAQFQYQVVDEDTLFVGPFSMKHADPRRLLNSQDLYFSFTGGFEEFLPSGSWVFSIGTYNSSRQDAHVTDHQYLLNVDGAFHEASGTLKGGKLHGTWVQKVLEIKDSEEVASLFESKITFEEGVPQQSFSLRNRSMTLIGRFLRDGLAHDVWELFDQTNSTTAEQWHFQEGRLEKIVIPSDEGDQVIPVYPPMEDPEVLTLNHHYLDIINLYLTLTSDGSADQGGVMDQLLKENAGYYHKIDDILSSVGGDLFTADFKVKVNHYPLTNNELTLLDSIKNTYARNQKEISDWLNNTQLKLLELSDYEVSYLLSVFQVLHDHHLAVIAEVIDYHESEVLAYVPRSGPLVRKLWKEGEPDLDIQVVYDSAGKEVTRNYLVPDASMFNLDTTGLAGIHQLSQYVSACIASISNDLNRKLNLKEREEALMELEEDLIHEVTKLNHHLDSLTTEDNSDVLTSIRETTKAELSAYSKMESTPDKITQVNELINCFGNLSSLSSSISSLSARNEEISKVYTDDVWNPFTYTVMREEVKTRITSAYSEVLIPYVINEVQENLSCSNAVELERLLNDIHDRMLALRTEDTDRMERRKLRNEKDPEVILQLFGIDPLNYSAEQ